MLMLCHEAKVGVVKRKSERNTITVHSIRAVQSLSYAIQESVFYEILLKNLEQEVVGIKLRD